jgi:hypothetical protein
MSRSGFIVPLACIAVVAGCGSSVGSRAPSAFKPRQLSARPLASQQGLLAVGPDQAAFITWTRIEGYVAGTIYTSSPYERSQLFTGAIRGSVVTLTPRAGNNWNGTRNGDGITMSTVESSGLLRTFSFRPARGSEYDAAVHAVRATTMRARLLAAHTRHGTPEQRRLAADEVAAERDVQDLRNALETARLDGLSVPNLLALERRDAVKAAYDARVASRGANAVCARAGRITQDARRLEDDARGIAGASKTFQFVAGVVGHDSARLRAALGRLRAVQHALLGRYHAAAAEPALADARLTMPTLRRTVIRGLARARRLSAAATAEGARAPRACGSRDG